ncbi:MAG: homoserine kinase [Gemmatimonadetes bacterium]|nr:homoserine kinase [Gemmatimonadota bacterium]
MKVRVPATAANLGPGYDCLGMALDIWNELTVERGPFRVNITGEGAAQLPRDETNLIVKTVVAAFEAAGEPVPGLSYTCRNAIPLTRGLGSSSAAIVSGLAAGAKLSGLDRRLDRAALFSMAADIEGHPDNAAPATLGGCRVGIRDGDRWIADRVRLPEGIVAVLFIPDVEGSTATARAILPREVPMVDAVFNMGRAALLVNALASGNLGFLRQATEDRLHQPARSRLYPGMNELIGAALDAGAHGAFLAGAGPAVMALATARHDAVLAGMEQAARELGVAGRAIATRPVETGVQVVEAG